MQAVTTLSDHTLLLNEEAEKLRWFLLPSEAAAVLLRKPPPHLPKPPPFTPRTWGQSSNKYNTVTPTTKEKKTKEISSEHLLKQTSQAEVQVSLCNSQADSSCAKSDCENMLNDSSSNTGLNGASLCLGDNTTNSSTLQTETQQSVDSGLSHNRTTDHNEHPSIDSASSRVDCRALGQACPLVKQTKTDNKTKQNKHDSKIEKTVKQTAGTKPKFFHPPKSIFKPMAEVSRVSWC